MGSLFGKPKKKASSRVTELDKAVLQLKQQRDKLKQYQKRITLNLEKERDLARKLLQENKKDRAKLLLRKKKFQEQILNRTDQQLENLDKMTHDIEFAAIEVQVVQGLKSGNDALKKIQALMSIEDIEKILDETQEAVEKQREINDLLSGSLTTEEEDDVLDELNSIISETMPDVPHEKVPAEYPESENVVEDELELPDIPTSRIGEKVRKPRRQLVEAS